MPQEFEERLEITTGVVCPNNCKEYCPKEVFIKNYAGDKSQLLSLSDFKRILSTVPRGVGIDFSGFCEPFVNTETVEMLRFAHNSGYKLAIFTTLRGASESDIDELIKIPFSSFYLHLPDGKHLSFPLTNEYLLNLFKVIQGIRNVKLVSMDDSFKSDNRENVVRGLNRKSHRFGYCRSWVKPDFVVLPNGNVQLCCMDFGLWHTVGNLLTEDYSQIRRRFIHSHKFELCGYCSRQLPYQVYALRRAYFETLYYLNAANRIVIRAYNIWKNKHFVSESR